MATRMKAEASQSIHLAYADHVRVYSIIAIVLLHVSSPVVVSYRSIGLCDWWAGNLLDSATRWGVPVFIMLSGLLLLDPLKVESAGDFFRKRASRVLVPLVVWFPLYLLWVRYWHGIVLDFSYLKKLPAFGPYYHLYFLYIIIAMYLITPFLRKHVHEMCDSSVVLLGVFFLLIGSVNSVVSCATEPRNVDLIIPRYVHFFFFISGFIGYYIGGFYLRSITLSVRGFYFVLAGFLLAVAVTAAGTASLISRFGIETFGLYLYDYFSPLCILMAFSMFLIIKESSRLYPPKKRNWRLSRLVTQELAPCTFGVYLIHPIFIDVMDRLLSSALPEHSLGLAHVQSARLIILSIAVILSSFAATFFIRKVPYMRKIMG